MSDIQIAFNINKAIVSHSTWKVRLKKSIQTQTSEFDIAYIKSTQSCEFGQWLSSAKASLESDEAYDLVLELHQSLHEETARITALALAGNSTEAQAAIEPGSAYAKISSKLTITLMAWKKRAQLLEEPLQ
ncbi:MAG: CZB domain-containing protein [Reichenbachiella sp.]|uniref:CZB domain-containing protein n=1 Tax=Reichenbachiella sp. TaxID=2184521 RepID=UPI003297BC6C